MIGAVMSLMQYCMLIDCNDLARLTIIRRVLVVLLLKLRRTVAVVVAGEGVVGFYMPSLRFYVVQWMRLQHVQMQVGVREAPGETSHCW